MKKILLLTFLFFTLFACSDDDPVVKSIELDVSELNLGIGDEYQFKVIYSPSKAEAPTYIWSEVVSMDSYPSKGIISIDQNGKIKALREGTCFVHVEALQENGNTLVTSCSVIVKPVEAKGLKLNKNEVTLKNGETETLTYTFNPENTTVKEISWSSSNPSIVNVSNGVLTAKGIGEAVITATVRNTSIKDICKVIVNPVKLEGLELEEKEKTLMKGDFVILSPVFTPENASNRNIQWTSSNSQVATVNGEGEIQAISVGDCLITGVSEDGSFEVSCKLTVVPKALEGISFETTIDKIEVGGQVQFKVKFTPEDAENKNIKWYSSNSSIASVSQEGIVTGNAIGTTTITAISDDGSYKISTDCRVASIEEFMDLYFPSASVTIINGYVWGSVSSALLNRSSKTVRLVRLQVLDSSTLRVIGETTDESLLGQLYPGDTRSLGLNLNSIYAPFFIWEFDYNGQRYSVSHRYGGSYYSTQPIETRGKEDNLIELRNIGSH